MTGTGACPPAPDSLINAQFSTETRLPSAMSGGHGCSRGPRTITIVAATITIVAATIIKVAATIIKVAPTITIVAATITKVAPTITIVAATITIVAPTITIVAAQITIVAATLTTYRGMEPRRAGAMIRWEGPYTIGSGPSSKGPTGETAAQSRPCRNAGQVWQKPDGSPYVRAPLVRPIPAVRPPWQPPSRPRGSPSGGPSVHRYRP